MDLKLDLKSVKDKLDKLSGTQKIVLAGVVAVLVMLLFGYFVIWPDVETIESRHKEIATLEKSVAEKKEILKRLATVEKEFESRQSEFKYAQALIPDDQREMDKLLSAIESSGKILGVEFQLYQPAADEIKKEFYAEKKVQLKVRGRFHDIMAFFSQITQLPRLVSLSKISLRPNQPIQNFQYADTSLSCESVLLVYRMLTEAEQKALEEEKKKGKKAS